MNLTLAVSNYINKKQTHSGLEKDLTEYLNDYYLKNDSFNIEEIDGSYYYIAMTEDFLPWVIGEYDAKNNAMYIDTSVVEEILQITNKHNKDINLFNVIEFIDDTFRSLIFKNTVVFNNSIHIINHPTLNKKLNRLVSESWIEVETMLVKNQINEAIADTLTKQGFTVEINYK